MVARRTAGRRTARCAAAAYQLFHPGVQRWIYDAGWQRLHAVQEQAAPVILAGNRDVIIAAETAGGKSEAAWLPICSALARSAESGEVGPGIQAMVISPLKALINDQYERLVGLCERLALPVHRWHGDVPGGRKAVVLRAPAGVLLITPESIEAMFVRHPDRIGRVLADLRYIVIDELHAFIGTVRGAQLQSLLHRIEVLLGRRIPRIALSATLGDLEAAADSLRPGDGDAVEQVTSPEDGGEIRLQIRGYLARAARPEAGSGGAGTCGTGPSGTGPFARVDRSVFAALLRDLGRHELIQQDSRGLLLPGSRGDRLVNHYNFYAAFQTSPDYRLVAAGRTIGTLPVERPLAPGTLMIFGGGAGAWSTSIRTAG